MNTKTQVSKELQELLDKVFPPYTGPLEEMLGAAIRASQEARLIEAYEYANNFNPRTATEAEWQKLDWAFSVPGFTDMYPELAFQTQMWLEDHYSIVISIKDFETILDYVITAVSFISNDTKNADTTVKVIKPVFKNYLRKDVADRVGDLLTEAMVKQCVSKGIPVDSKLCKKYFGNK